MVVLDGHIPSSLPEASSGSRSKEKLHVYAKLKLWRTSYVDALLIMTAAF